MKAGRLYRLMRVSRLVEETLANQLSCSAHALNQVDEQISHAFKGLCSSWVLSESEGVVHPLDLAAHEATYRHAQAKLKLLGQARQERIRDHKTAYASHQLGQLRLKQVESIYREVCVREEDELLRQEQSEADDRFMGQKWVKMQTMS